MKLLAILFAGSLVFAACTPAEKTAVSPTSAPVETASDTMTDDMGAEETTAQTIVDIAASNEDFSTLVAAVTAAGLAETLSGPGPFTVFAPTDAAFAKLPEGTVEGLLDQPEELAAILQLHVVSGSVMAADVVELEEATMLSGDTLPITVEGDTVMIGEATVVATDIVGSNGVIHVIDSVLLP